MKKCLLILLSAVLLLFTACESWMQDDDFYSDIENDVKVANAAGVTAYVRYANSKMGTTEPSGSISQKVDVPFTVSAVTNDDYGFVKWVAFSTSDFPTNQQHSSLVYESAEAYAKDYKGLELASGFVSFTDPTNPITEVNIYSVRDDIFIMPLVAKRPTVVTSVPTNGRSDVVKNSQIRILFSKPIDEKTLTDEFGNSNIQVTSGRAVLTENSDDLDALDITSNFNFKLSKTKKLLTISAKKDSAGKAFIFDGNSQINVNIFEDVCDTDGFKMNGSYKFSFTTGTKEDSLAPSIEKLTAGIDNDATKYQQYRYSESLANQHTKVAEEATNDLDDYIKLDKKALAADKQPVLKQRVKDKLNIYVLATDIAGAGANVTIDGNTTSESDVALVQIRACLYVDKDGNPVTTSANAFPNNSSGTDSSSVISVKEFGYSMGMKDSSFKGKFEDATNNAKVGTLFTYDLSSLDDGLIKIDLWAVDMVGNSGDSEVYSDTYDNGYRSIFVVKDSTAPDAAANKDLVVPDLTSAEKGNWFNQTTYSSIQIQGDVVTPDSENLVDDGHSALVSAHDDMKWIIKPTADTSWVNTISKNDSAWQPITDDYSGFTLPSTDGPVTLTYALMDDLGNVSRAVPIQAFNYDGTLPSVKANLSWIADTGSTAGIASDNTLNTQTLVIPIKEMTAGIKKVDLTVKYTKTDSNGTTTVEYETPFGSNGEGIEVVAGGTTLDSSAFTATGKTLTFTEPQTGFDSSITIKNIKISDAETAEDREGSYSIIASVTDAANNVTTTQNQTNTAVALSIDSTPAVINRINVPDIKKAINFTDTANEVKYWIDYNSTNLDKTGSIPVAKSIYVTFTENNSGAKVFDFTGSNMTLQSSSVMYKVTWNESQNKWVRDGAAIASNPSSNKFTLTTPVKSSGSGNATVEITNVKLYSADSNDASYLKLKISDTATNESLQKTEIKSGSWTISAANGFYYDSSAPVSSEPSLEDNNTETSVAAEAGYTNSEFVKATFTVTPSESGIESVTIVSGAVFEGDTDHALSIKVGATTLTAAQYQISSDKKTITFKKTGDTVPNADSIILKPSSGDQIIEVNNLKLTGRPTGTDGKFTDGDNLVKFKAKSFGGKESSVAEKNIVLDVHAPEWIGGGLYTGTVTSPDNVYPHPASDGSSEGLTLSGRSDLYFYRQSSVSIRINAKFEDSNPKLNSSNKTITRWSGGNISGTTIDDDYITGGLTGDFTANVYDKAGNKSVEKAFHIENVSSLVTTEDSRKNIKINLENDVTLEVPAGADAEKNTFLNGVRSPESRTSDFDYYGSSQSASIWVFNYILKTFSGDNYKLKVPVHTYAAGGEQSVPIEQYGVVHTYRAFPSTSEECSTDSFIPHNPTWHDYKLNSTEETDRNLKSYVDSNGDIIITLPNHDCPPVSVWLMDGCGNTEFILLNPGLKDKIRHDLDRDLSVCTTRAGTEKQGLRNEAVAYMFDNRVGVNDSYAGTENQYYPDETVVNPGDITFYRTNNGSIPYLKLTNISDRCRFLPANSGVADFETESEALNYSVKSKIIIWQGNGTPAKEKFYDSSITGSEWYGYKEFYDEEHGYSSLFYLQNNFPVFDNTEHNTGKFQLWYIIEDRVGNYVIKQLKNKNSSSVTDWLYDVTPPELNVSSAQNVNYIDDDETDNEPGVNYYSDNSYLSYTISDNQSGIQNNGSENDPIPSYSTFAARVKNYTPESGFSLNNVEPASNDTISVSGVKDWAGNEADEVGLTNEESNKWFRQNTPPKLAESCVSATNPISGQPDLTFNAIEDVAVDGVTEKGKKLPIIGGKYCTQIDVTLKVTDSVQLLGWYTSKSKLTTFKDFYTLAEVKASNDAENIKRTITYNGSGSYTCSFKKKKQNGTTDDKTSTWHNKFGGEWYFYPVNRAGLICKTPVVIEFVDNPVPTVKTETIEYSGVVNYRAGTDDAVSYTKTADSFVTFETTNKPSKCYLIYGDGTSDYVSIELSGSNKISDNKFKVPLAKSSSAMAANTFANKELKLKVFTTSGSRIIEESDEYVLGVAANGSYNAEGKNNWTFDQTAPVVADITTIISNKTSPETPVAAEKYPNNSSGIYYIDSDEAFIALSSTATDIDYWEWDNGTGSWSETPSKLELSQVTLGEDESAVTYSGYKFTVPAQTEAAKTYQFRAVDKAANKATAKSVKLRKDNEGPVLKSDYTTFSYKLKKGTTSSSSDIAETAGSYVKEVSGNTVNIRYNTTEVKGLYLDYSCVEDKSSGIARKYYCYGENGNFDTTCNDTTSINLSSSYPTYIIKAKDNVGHVSTFVTINLVADSNPPTIKLGSVKSHTDGKEDITVNAVPNKYWIKGEKAVITLVGTGDAVGENRNDLKEYQWDQGKGGTNNWEKIDLENGTFSIAASEFENSAKTYRFKVLDTVGHQSGAISVVLQKDATPPEGSVAYTLSGSNTPQKVDENNTLGDYISSTTEETTSIIYNPATVTKIVFDTTGIQDVTGGSGFNGVIYRRTTEGDSAIDAAGVELTDSLNGETYVLIAKDNAGNELELGSYVFTADKEGPVPSNLNGNKLNGYTVKEGGAIRIVYDNQIWTDGKSNAYSAGTTILKPVTDAVKYSLVLTEPDKYFTNDEVAELSHTWNTLNTAGEIPLPTSGMTTPHRRIALFFKDNLKNVSGPYYLASNENSGWDWWIEEVALTEEGITISTDKTWQTGASEYEISVKLPLGAVVKTISLLPANENSGITWATGGGNPPQGEYAYPIKFKGYEKSEVKVDGAAWKGASFDGWINVKESTEVGISFKVFVFANNNQGDIKVKINGIEKAVFPVANGGSAGGNGTDSSINTNGKLGFLSTVFTGLGGNDTGNASESRVAQVFNSVANVFARNSEVTADDAVTGKPAESAKKAAKKAKKTAKKAAKKANTKLVSTSSTTGAGNDKPVMAVEAAEIVDQTLTSAVPELAAATESVVSEIAGVTEKVSGEAEVITTIAPAASTNTEAQNQSQTSAEADADRRSPSKSASIVIMLAILSSFSAVWYLQKNRKK